MTADIDTGAVPEVSVGVRIYMARQHAHLTQDQLAALVLSDRKTISNYEVGRTRPGRRSTELIAVACGVNRKWLETGEAGPNEPGPGLSLVSYTATDLNCEPADLARNLRAVA